MATIGTGWGRLNKLTNGWRQTFAWDVVEDDIRQAEPGEIWEFSTTLGARELQGDPTTYTAAIFRNDHVSILSYRWAPKTYATVKAFQRDQSISSSGGRFMLEFITSARRLG